MSHRTVQSAAICRLSNKHKQLICCAGSDFGERKTSHGFLLLLFRFFSITRCLIFGYFCLIVSLAIGCSRFFFSYLGYARRNKAQYFFFSSNRNRRACVSCLFTNGAEAVDTGRSEAAKKGMNSTQQLNSPTFGLLFSSFFLIRWKSNYFSALDGSLDFRARSYHIIVLSLKEYEFV